MGTSKLSKIILADIETTITELRNMQFIRDEKGVAQHTISNGCLELSFSGKNDTNKIMYDKHISCSYLMEKLLSERQYNVLLYDKSILQAEFILEGEEIIKERLVFIKKHNKIWTTEEVDNHDALDEDWFSDETGIPTLIRIDYDPKSHKECIHSSAHLTLSNHESCRIPVKHALTFSEFVCFVLFHFYNVELSHIAHNFSQTETLTHNEKKMIHIYWE